MFHIPREWDFPCEHNIHDLITLITTESNESGPQGKEIVFKSSPGCQVCDERYGIGGCLYKRIGRIFSPELLCALLHPLTRDLDQDHVSVQRMVDIVQRGLVDGMQLSVLESLILETCGSLSAEHPEYGTLAGRIAQYFLHSRTESRFSTTVYTLYSHTNPLTGVHAPLVSKQFFEFVMANASELDALIKQDRDFLWLDYFGHCTKTRSYDLSIDGQTVERLQHLLLREAIAVCEDMESIAETYNDLSLGYYTHATPTIFNAGTQKPQLASCYLLGTQSDSIEGIYDTLKQCAIISKMAGGVGLAIHNIRANGTRIGGTNGKSNGIVPMLRVFNDTARYADQGGGKRKGSFNVFLEPWHNDVFDFLELKKNNGKEELRARDLFYTLWIPDLFMKRTQEDGAWSLFCPHESPGLMDVWGDEFEALYTRYEREGRARRVVQARELWYAILNSQAETGGPFIMYKDACNRKSNHQHLGTIQNGNLCTEIVQYSSPDEVAVCNLGSLGLPRFVCTDTMSFDFHKLYEKTKRLAKNLNRVIDVNYYPIPEAHRSNMRHRPIGVGVQGLADVFMMLRMPFCSAEARALNRDIFETIYYAALETSCDLAELNGHPYPSYEGSPVSRGILQFDMWGVDEKTLSGRWDWQQLRRRIAQHGIYNSLLVAPMPTASTSQILGNHEGIDPYTSNMYCRRVLAGEFPVINRHLVRDLTRLGLWNDAMRQRIVANNGSIKAIEEIPQDIRDLYPTVWELSMRAVIDMAADRGAFIDQSQSLNLYVAHPTIKTLTSMHFYAWQRGLKTGMYYLRTLPARETTKYTVDADLVKNVVDDVVDRYKNMTLSRSTLSFSPNESTSPSSLDSVDTIQDVDDTLKSTSEPVCTREEGCLMCSA